MVTKRKRVEEEKIDYETLDIIDRHLQSMKPMVHLGFYMAEIDKIMEERLHREQITRPKQKRKKKTITRPNISLDENGNMSGDDWTCRLPEDVLHLILSFMTMREIVSTSILSTKWRHLWRSSSNLDFDILNMTGRGFELGDTSRKNKARFVKWVNRILMLHCGNKIDSLMIRYPLGPDYGCDFDQWIQFAVDKGVEKLNVDVFACLLSRIPSESKTYKFPYWLFAQEGSRSNLKHLSLKDCTFGLPPNFSSFNSLISLTLRTSRLEDTLDNIFANCVSLKWFSMDSCSCPVRIKVAGAHQLMHLRIYNCEAKEIEVHDAVNFASFEYGGFMFRRIMFKNSAQPVRLSLDGLQYQSQAACTYALGGFMADFPQVETFMLCTPDWKINEVPVRLPTFTKLKVLVLTLSRSNILLDMTSSFLEAAPFLVKLELCLPSCPNLWTKIRVHKKSPLEGFCRHQHLKEVELHNFHGYYYEFDLAIYLLNNAVLLAKMKIVRKTRAYEGNGGWIIPPCKHKVGSKLVHNKLCGKVPSNTQLIVV